MTRLSTRIRLHAVATALALFFTAFSAAGTLDKEERDLEFGRADRRATFLEQQEEPESLVARELTPCVDGLASTYPCDDVDLLSFLPLADIGGGSGNDIWGWTDPSTGREYALMGRTTGTAFIDITDPVDPIYLGNLPAHTSSSVWRDIKVYANHAYIVSEAPNHGMQVFDLTALRDVASPPATFSEAAHYSGFGSAHNVAINVDTGYAYAVGTGTCAGGPHFVDLATPTAPAFAGCHIETIYTHDTQCVVYAGPDSTHQGREICVNSNENKINIIDVTNKANPLLLSQTTYTGVAYTHQGWLTEDHVYYLQGDELDEQNQGHNTRTRIFDVSDLDAPVLIGTYDGPTGAIDHNLYTHEGYVYAANYRAGLQILDLSDVANGNLSQVAYFDVYPSSDSASFNGAWSVYPYFESGTVVVSGIEQGLFVLRPTLAQEFTIELSSEVVGVCAPGDHALTVELIERNGYSGDVTLDATGLPAGTAASFLTNPVEVPGSTELTVSVSGAAPGSYAFSVSGTDGLLVREQPATLQVADVLPSVTTPLAPTDGATDVSRSASLSWSAAAGAFVYRVEISDSPGFGTILRSVEVEGTTVVLDPPLDPSTMFYWRVHSLNPCGTTPATTVYGFTTLEIPPILLVDDDDNGPNVRADYSAALDALGRDHDVWNTNNSDDEPSAAILAPYSAVIWFTGDEFGGTAGPGPGGESALISWLESSRCLLIASQDFFYDRGLTSLIDFYLGVSTATSDVAQSSAIGQGSIFGGLGPFALSFPYSNYSDTLVPDAFAEVAFDGSSGSAAVNYDGGYYRSAYLGFGLEGLPGSNERQAVLAAFLNWCDSLPTEDGDADGTVNGQDCAPGDGGAWTAPSPARELSAAPLSFFWQAPEVPGGTVVSYDVLRSSDPSDFSTATCRDSGGTDTQATDFTILEPGQLFFYLVRAENACGSALQPGSGSAQRSGADCF